MELLIASYIGLDNKAKIIKEDLELNKINLYEVTLFMHDKENNMEINLKKEWEIDNNSLDKVIEEMKRNVMLCSVNVIYLNSIVERLEEMENMKDGLQQKLYNEISEFAEKGGV